MYGNTVKTYSEVSFTGSTVEEVSVEEEQKEEEANVIQTAEDSPVLRSAMQFSMFNKRNKNVSCNLFKLLPSLSNTKK